MAQRVRVGSAADMPEDSGLVVKAGGEEIAIFKVEDAYFGCSARCPHAGAPLADGFLDGTVVTCPWHGWSFELNCVGAAPRDGVERYKVVAEGNDLYVELPN